MSTMDCKMAKILLKKFGYLEKRVTYLEGKSRGQENLIQKLKIKLKKLKNRNKERRSSQVDCEEPVGDSNQEESEETPVDVKPNLIEVTGSNQKAQLGILKKDKKLSQKLVVKLGVRCSEKFQEIVNSSSEKSIERDRRTKTSQNQGKTKRVHKNTKTGGEASKPKGKMRKAYICKFCSKSFPSFEHLSRHMRVHTGERPFKCKICSKSFKVMGHLKRHCYTYTDLSRHMRVDTGGKGPFKCQICSKSFITMGNLKRHGYVHTGEKRFSCSVCSKSFTQSSNLQYHMSIHKGTYSCSICSKKLGSKSNLKIHKRTHSRTTI